MKLLQNIALYISLAIAEGLLNLDPTALFAFDPLYLSKKENCPDFFGLKTHILGYNLHAYQFFQKGQLDSVSTIILSPNLKKVLRARFYKTCIYSFISML